MVPNRSLFPANHLIRRVVCMAKSNTNVLPVIAFQNFYFEEWQMLTDGGLGHKQTIEVTLVKRSVSMK